MAKNVIMPALGMAQETGTLLQWFKAPGDSITKGEPLMEVETDKASVEVEATASGILANVTAKPGDVVPVGQTMAVILTPGEATSLPKAESTPASITATPVAARIAAEYKLDLGAIKPGGGRVQKEDVLTYLAAQKSTQGNGRALASPKARRMAQERELDLKTIAGRGPDGAVLAADVMAVQVSVAPEPTVETFRRNVSTEPEMLAVSKMWRVMAERVSQAWTTIPHFYLLREVNATRLMAWREDAQKRATAEKGAGKISYTDLLVKLVGAALRAHPRVNASWKDGDIILNHDINIGLAVAVDEGLVVPVIHHADQMSLSQLAARRKEIVAKAQANKLPLSDISGGTFTISNLGMYGVDAFNAIVNPPQAAILAVGRIAERVVPLDGQPAVQPMMTLSLSCDHRVVDGARGAQFLQTLAEMIEEPLRLLD